MSRDVSGALFARIAAYPKIILDLVKRLREARQSESHYRRGEYYMRGPGPKWREKHGVDRTADRYVQQPMRLGEKWDD